MIRLTPVVKNLIIICVGVFILNMFIPGLTDRLALYQIGTPSFKPYQLFSYMFAHGSTGHIFFNMLMFAFIGPHLEMVWGFKRFLKFYLFCGIGAAVIYMLLEYVINQGFGGSMVGASGAIYGLLMAYGVLYPENEFKLMLPPISIKGKYLVIVLGVSAWIFDRSGRTAHFAHLGGAVAGFVALRFGLLND